MGKTYRRGTASAPQETGKFRVRFRRSNDRADDFLVRATTAIENRFLVPHLAIDRSRVSGSRGHKADRRPVEAYDRFEPTRSHSWMSGVRLKQSATQATA